MILFTARLEVTSQAAITPSFIVTSALRSESVTGEIVSTAIVGETIYWTIDIPCKLFLSYKLQRSLKSFGM